jgi:hypothetical protein
MNTKMIFRLIILVFLLSPGFGTEISAQPPDPPGSHGLNGNQGAGGGAPVDGGILMLALGGIAYGAIKLIRKRKW